MTLHLPNRFSWRSLAIFSFVNVLLFHSAAVFADADIRIDIPHLNENPYFKPYVAIWLETPDRKHVTTLAVWYEQDTWLKDLRQWWRKAGRNAGSELDAVTGATRKPGQYTLTWDGKAADGTPVPAGDYLLNVEAAREEGGRSYQRLPVTLVSGNIFTLPAEAEFGEVVLTVN